MKTLLLIVMSSRKKRVRALQIQERGLTNLWMIPGYIIIIYTCSGSMEVVYSGSANGIIFPHFAIADY